MIRPILWTSGEAQRSLGSGVLPLRFCFAWGYAVSHPVRVAFLRETAHGCSGPPILMGRVPSRKAHPIIGICCLPPIQPSTFPGDCSCPQIPCPIPYHYPEGGPAESVRRLSDFRNRPNCRTQFRWTSSPSPRAVKGSKAWKPDLGGPLQYPRISAARKAERGPVPRRDRRIRQQALRVRRQRD